VDKIVGPGNLFVTAAKKLVSFDCGIDMLAGPTEAVVVSQQGKPALIAADLVAQSEHDPEALSIFITANDRLAFEVQKELAKQSANNSIAKTALKQNGVILVANSAEQAMEVANIIAPEHITVDSGELDSVRDAGSIFLGDFSPQTMGDYISGPNHVLPTGAVARHRGGLSVLDYLKVITVQELSSQGLARLGPWAVQLAEAEGLIAHAESVRIRSSLA
jgi:histidinol dehydrogenase